jgi:hypothetical protein
MVRTRVLRAKLASHENTKLENTQHEPRSPSAQRSFSCFPVSCFHAEAVSGMQNLPRRYTFSAAIPA